MPEQLNPSGSGEAPIVTRRSLFVGAAATLICAPTVVRFVSLMPVRGVHEIKATAKPTLPIGHFPGAAERPGRAHAARRSRRRER